MGTLRGSILGASVLLLAGCPEEEGSGPTVSGSSATVGTPTSGNDSSAGSDTDATSSTSGTGGEVSTTGGADTPDTFPTCMEFAAWASGCPGTDSLEELLALCNDVVSQSYGTSEECGTAYEAAFGCLTGQDCSAADLSAPPEACASEAMAVEAACNVAPETTGTSTG